MRRLHIIVIFLSILLTANAQIYIDTTPQFHPKTIPSTYFTNAVNNLSLKNFSADSALQLLFPGKLYKFKYQYDDYELMAWRCPRCPVIVYENEWAIGTDTFPTHDDESNGYNATDTRILTTLPFKDAAGHNCMLFATSSTHLGEVLLVGRFSCAWLGLAVFEQINNSWLVTAFNPAILCTGSFSQAPTPELLTLNGITLSCKIESANGPGGGPFNGTINIIGLMQKNMHPLFTRSMISRSNSLCYWETTSSLIPDTTQSIPQLILTTTGQFIRNALTDDYDSTAIYRLLPQKITRQTETGFTITTRYRYNPSGKKSYALVSQAVRLKPLGKKKEE